MNVVPIVTLAISGLSLAVSTTIAVVLLKTRKDVTNQINETKVRTGKALDHMVSAMKRELGI